MHRWWLECRGTGGSLVATRAGGKHAAVTGSGGREAGDAAEQSPARGHPGLLAQRGFLEVRFGGSGGQGVILMGVILAMAAARDHRYVVQTQSYGPEARGGYSRSDVIISDSPIDYPELQGIDLLVVLSQAAADHYVGLLRATGVFVFDSEKVASPPRFRGLSYGVPFVHLAVEETGREQVANVLTLGAVVALTGVVSAQSLRQAVGDVVPKGTEEWNERALVRGLGLRAEEWLRSG